MEPNPVSRILKLAVRLRPAGQPFPARCMLDPAQKRARADTDTRPKKQVLFCSIATFTPIRVPDYAIRLPDTGFTRFWRCRSVTSCVPVAFVGVSSNILAGICEFYLAFLGLTRRPAPFFGATRPFLPHNMPFDTPYGLLCCGYSSCRPCILLVGGRIIALLHQSVNLNYFFL